MVAVIDSPERTIGCRGYLAQSYQEGSIMRIKLIIEDDSGSKMDVYRLGPEATKALFHNAIQDVTPVRKLWRVHEGWAVAKTTREGAAIDDGTAYPDRCADNAVAAVIKFGAS